MPSRVLVRSAQAWQKAVNSNMSQLATKGIVGESVRLRALCRDDLDLLRSFVNDPEVMRFSNGYRPINDFQQERWFQEVSQATDGIWFAIDDIRQQDAKLIGACCLVGIDWIGRLAEFRIRIGERGAWGQGLGAEASRLLMRYGFMDLNLERIWLRVFASNRRAIRMYERLGFQAEGKLRRSALVQGLAEDVVLMGVLRDEWRGTAEHAAGQPELRDGLR